MNNEKLSLNDTISLGKKRKISVSDLVNIKGEIFKYIKQGYIFDDEVLSKAGIKKTIRDEKVLTVVAGHNSEKDNKIYPKETENIRNVLKLLHTIDNQLYGKQENDFSNIETDYGENNVLDDE